MILSLKVWTARTATEIAIVKPLPQGGVDWAVEGGPTGALYKGKTVQKLIPVGVAITTRLEQKKIVSILDMKILTEEQVKVVATQAKGIGDKKLLLAWNQAQQSVPGSCPAKIDYRTAENRYLAKYGDLEWEKMLGSSQLMSP